MRDVSHLLVWFEMGHPFVSQLHELPDVFLHKAQLFHAEAEYFGDVDYLRDHEKRLVGFAYLSGGTEQKLVWNELISQSQNVSLDDGALVILIGRDCYEAESIQAMGTQVYRSHNGEVMLAIPNWGFGELGFDLETENVPWPERLKED